MNATRMNLKKGFLALLCLLCFIACTKDEKFKGNKELQIFWEFTGFHQQDGQVIHEPNFNKDELFHYQVNLLFLWNGHTQQYEIQGQGPYDLFWGSYHTSANELSLTSFKTTGITSELESLNDYDNLFFNALCKASRYSIENGKLKIYFEDDDKYMLFQAQKDPALIEKQHMNAQINTLNWKAEESTSARVTSGLSGQPYLSIGGTSKLSLSDGYIYNLGITINGVPQKGVFPFDNDGLVQGQTATASLTAFPSQGGTGLSTWSTKGEVTITQLTRSYVAGYFSFEAEDKDGTVKKIVEQGQFLIGLHEGEYAWFKPFNPQ